MYRFINSKKCRQEINWNNYKMDHSSVKLNKDQVPGVKLTVNLENLVQMKQYGG